MRPSKELLEFIGSNNRANLEKKFGQYVFRKKRFVFYEIQMGEGLWDKTITYQASKNEFPNFIAAGMAKDQEGNGRFVVMDGYRISRWKLVF